MRMSEMDQLDEEKIEKEDEKKMEKKLGYGISNSC